MPPDPPDGRRARRHARRAPDPGASLGRLPSDLMPMGGGPSLRRVCEGSTFQHPGAHHLPSCPGRASSGCVAKGAGGQWWHLSSVERLELGTSMSNYPWRGGPVRLYRGGAYVSPRAVQTLANSAAPSPSAMSHRPWKIAERLIASRASVHGAQSGCDAAPRGARVVVPLDAPGPTPSETRPRDSRLTNPLGITAGRQERTQGHPSSSAAGQDPPPR